VPYVALVALAALEGRTSRSRRRDCKVGGNPALWRVSFPAVQGSTGQLVINSAASLLPMQAASSEVQWQQVRQDRVTFHNGAAAMNCQYSTARTGLQPAQQRQALAMSDLLRKCFCQRSLPSAWKPRYKQR
jgi:hypothetical protein